MRERRRIIRIAGVAFDLVLVILFPSSAIANCIGDQLDMPISLAVGHVRTPEFKTKGSYNHSIEITAKTVLPPAELSCKMGISEGPQDPVDCNKEPLIEADWTVSSGGHIVARGSSRDSGKSGYYQGIVFKRVIGGFKANKNKTYTIDVNFTRDGSALAIADPRLVVEAGDMYIYSIKKNINEIHDTLYSTYMPLRPGHFRSPEFEGNNGLNIINFDVLGRLPAGRLLCLFGIQDDKQPKCIEESVLDFDWTVWSEGNIIASGTSRPDNYYIEHEMYTSPIELCGGLYNVWRSVGHFPGRKGQKFSIELNIKKDGSKLDIALPRLSVVRGYPASGFSM